MSGPDEDDVAPEEQIAMQPRCLACLREMYAPSVLGYSIGKESCPWCGYLSRKMGADEYRDSLTLARRAHERFGPGYE